MLTIDSQITDVVVYPDRARVTRRGTLSLTAGLHQIEFGELPLWLQDDSVRVSGRGTASASLLGVDVQRTHYAETPAVPVHQLEQRIEALRDEDKALEDQAAAAEMQAAFIKSLAAQAAEQLARGFALGRAALAQVSQLMAFTQEQVAQPQAAARDIARQRAALARRLTQLQKELQERQSYRPREKYTAVVEVEAKQAGDLTLDLSYVVGVAGWAAHYDLRANLDSPDAPELEVNYMGNIFQRTGEDWNQVSLTLSTAKPSRAGVDLKLQPWYINAAEPPQPRREVYAAKRLLGPPLAAMSSEEVADHDIDPELDMPEAQVNDDTASVTYQLPQKATILSGGDRPHKVNLTTLRLKPRLDILTVPALIECAYRRAKVVNQSDYLLVPGRASLFASGDYIGSQSLKQVAPNEEFELTLGVEDRITVKRELKAREVDKKLIGERRRVHAVREIEVNNLLDRAVTLEVRDQIPVARHEQIKVKLESVEPRPVEQTELNELRWSLPLEPRARRVIRFDFSVEYPTAMSVEGLP
ncbi:MAG: mucoidy inhibitor MuiA family protein [Chloroflexi bacterium]|nr:mucoidy inhibitor MuiA family protein [Chloroflexota bacterium]